MPFVNLKPAECVFSEDKKHKLARASTGVLVEFEGFEAFREAIWALIEEAHSDRWHIGGWLWDGPRSLSATPQNAKAVVERLNGVPRTRADWAKAAPVLKHAQAHHRPTAEALPAGRADQPEAPGGDASRSMTRSSRARSLVSLRRSR